VEITEVVANAFAMPLTSPSFPRGPYRYTNREHLIITYRTDREALERVVPEPLAFDEPLVRYDFLRMDSSTGFGRYSGSAQHLAVRLDDQHGNYTHKMFLDVHPPIAGGRELWGFPKKLASPSLRVERDTLVGTLDFGPVRIATGTMGYKPREVAKDPVLRALGEPSFLLKIIPHVDGTPRICELVRHRLGDLVLKGAWRGPCALELQPHSLAPVADLPVREVISGVHLVVDLTLNLGEVVWDYLAPKKAG
jgi:acetoacetate decarboxylase